MLEPTALMVRDANTASDAEACAEIYAPYVRDSVISFEYEPPTSGEFARRIANSHFWLVAESGERVLGFAYASRHRERAAYQWAADVSVYVRSEEQRRGVGRLLYSTVSERAADSGLRILCAGITQPNDASNRFHEALGFELVGTYRKIGWKSGSWHDTRWYQLDLAPGDSSPPAALRLATS